MPNRFQINQHRLAYSFIASIDGDHCLICKASPDKAKLQIDHADNNPFNWDPLNLHLLCQAHNLLFRGVPGSSRRARLRISSEARQDNRPFVLRAAGLSPKERFSDDVGRSPRCLTSRSA